MSDSSTVDVPSDRRRFVRKLVSLAALGSLTPLLLSERIGKAYAANLEGGAYSKIAGGDGNSTYDNFNFIGGGWGNKAGNNDGDATTQPYVTIGGGSTNTASGYAATVSGGYGNTASFNYATVGGGGDNQATNTLTTISGGSTNTASGFAATVPGGSENVAGGDYSLAAGRRAKITASQDGAFLWADDIDADFRSDGENEFAARATGGVRFVTGLNGSGIPLVSNTFVMTPAGNLGVGLKNPARSVHLQGDNAVFRMDRDVNSSAFILTRTALGDFNTVWKTFYVGVDASGVNNGSFFIGDAGTAVSGNSNKRLIIDNTGNILPPSDNNGNIGIPGQSWASIRAHTITQGDLVYENGVRSREEGEGIAFYNPKGTKIAVLDSEGNFHIKGKFMEDL